MARVQVDGTKGCDVNFFCDQRDQGSQGSQTNDLKRTNELQLSQNYIIQEKDL